MLRAEKVFNETAMRDRDPLITSADELANDWETSTVFKSFCQDPDYHREKGGCFCYACGTGCTLELTNAVKAPLLAREWREIEDSFEFHAPGCLDGEPY